MNIVRTDNFYITILLLWRVHKSKKTMPESITMRIEKEFWNNRNVTRKPGELKFATMVQNITEMYNSLLKSHSDLQEAYTNMKAMLKKKDEHYQAIIDKLNKKLEECEARKTKIRKFFNLQ